MLMNDLRYTEANNKAEMQGAAIGLGCFIIFIFIVIFIVVAAALTAS